MIIAVLDLKAVGVSDKTAKTVSSMLRTDMVNTGRFKVVERSQMDTILREQGFQKTGCTDQDCAIQLGKLMSAKKILIGEVITLGRSIIMNVRIIDVEKGLSEYAARDKAPSVDALDNTITRITKKLSERIEGRKKGFFAALFGEKEEEIKTASALMYTTLRGSYENEMD